jgi:hypothetical protein
MYLHLPYLFSSWTRAVVTETLTFSCKLITKLIKSPICSISKTLKTARFNIQHLQHTDIKTQKPSFRGGSYKETEILWSLNVIFKDSSWLLEYVRLREGEWQFVLEFSQIWSKWQWLALSYWVFRTTVNMHKICYKISASILRNEMKYQTTYRLATNAVLINIGYFYSFIPILICLTPVLD